MHVEHHPPGREHGLERQCDGQQRERGELETHRGQETDDRRGADACSEGGEAEEDGDVDHARTL
ncbi:MAG: hypothetical protein ABR569_13235 [Gaiellaceae bacterium]